LDNKDAPKSESRSVISALSMLSIRPKDETPEEKLKRKKALREFRQVCLFIKFRNNILYLKKYI